MRTLAVIPARLGATRLPRKPLRLLAGQPLILRVLERVAAMRVADACVVATDSEEIAAAVRGGGGEAVLTSAEHPSGTDRVAEVAALPAYRGYDAIVNVQGDEPFVDREAVLGAAAMVSERGFPLGTAAAPADTSILEAPHVVKVVAADDGRAMYFSRAPIPYLRDAGDRALLAGRVRQHVGVYAYAREALARWVALPPHPLEQIERLEQLRPLAAGLAMGVATVAGPVRGGIDTEDDLARANADWMTFTGTMS
ncbi:MAG TPA: 3-deoxy-manno-octulosonate cytidylyltransferase [Gemmatimonadaceae bacterium]|nr:3-deoxy-manno-octulosonate cytidylyltransferase [Gemmatimonadaceae bacterium]